MVRGRTDTRCCVAARVGGNGATKACVVLQYLLLKGCKPDSPEPARPLHATGRGWKVRMRCGELVRLGCLTGRMCHTRRL